MSMKKIISILSLATALCMVSCTKVELKENKGVGSLSVDMSLATQTRAALSESELMNTASVKIYKADFSGLVRSYTYSAMPSPLYLAADSYRVDVEAGEVVSANPEAASWENKSYKGSKEFTIVAGKETDVEVVANVNNAVTNISFDASVVENFNAGYTFTIGLDEDSQLVYDASRSGAEGYFIVDGLDEPSFTWTFTGTLAKDGSTFTKTGTISDILPGKLYKMNLKYTIKDGELNFTLTVDYTTDVFDDTIIFEPVSTGLASSPAYEIWAGHATVHADVDPKENEGATVQFAYSAGNDSWITVDGINDSEGTWKAVLTGLTGSTTYTYRLLINGEPVGEDMTLTTAPAPKLPNGSFEYVSNAPGFYIFYDPNCGVEEGKTMFWGSGNGEGSYGVEGSASMGAIITTIDTSEKKDGNQSVVAESKWAVVKFAAGNIFTGQFAGLVGTSGGKVNFGRPWTSRPTALKLYCKYSTNVINRVDQVPAGVEIVKNQTFDRAEVKFALGTWNYKTYGGSSASPVQVNTTQPSTFVDYNTDKSTIAYGNLVIYNDGYSYNGQAKVAANTSGWIEYTIPLDYKDLTTTPTHIIISCASSQYGDYFTGCDTSRLWIDKVELVYE